MATDAVLEALYRARDTLEALAGLHHIRNYPTPTHLDEYDRVIESLAGLEYDMTDLVIPGEPRGDNNFVGTSVWQPRFHRLQGFVTREIARAHQAQEATIQAKSYEHAPPNPNMVFLVHGQDSDAVETLTALLREVGLEPKAFADARKLTEHPMPYIGDVLDAAFQHAQAVLVVFTPDERVELSAQLRQPGQPITVEHQPRPNVLIEAGIALTTHSRRTIIVEMGSVRPISDLAGRHVVRWREDTPETRSELLDRLFDAGCPVQRDGVR